MEKENTKDLIKEMFIAMGDIVIQQLVDQLEAKGGLLQPKQLYIDQKKNELMKVFDAARLKKAKAFDRAGVLLHAKILTLPPVDRERIEKEFSSARLFVKEVVEGRVVLDDSSEKSLQSLIGLSNETLLVLYDIGYKSFVGGSSEDALAIFDILTSLNPRVFDYWIAQGLVERSIHLEKEALVSFAYATLLDPENPTPRYNSAELYYQQGQIEDAKIELEVLEEIIKAQQLLELRPEVESLRSKIFSKST